MIDIEGHPWTIASCIESFSELCTPRRVTSENVSSAQLKVRQLYKLRLNQIFNFLKCTCEIHLTSDIEKCVVSRKNSLDILRLATPRSLPGLIQICQHSSRLSSRPLASHNHVSAPFCRLRGSIILWTLEQPLSMKSQCSFKSSAEALFNSRYDRLCTFTW